MERLLLLSFVLCCLSLRAAAQEGSGSFPHAVVAPRAEPTNPGQSAGNWQAAPRYDGKTLAYWIEHFQRCESNTERRAVAEVIKAFGPDAASAVPTLVEMLDDRSREYRAIVGGILCDLGPAARSAVPALIRSLKEKTARSPEITIQVLGGIGADAAEAIPLLLAALHEEGCQVAATRALGRMGQAVRSAIPAIHQAIRAHGADPDSVPPCGSQPSYLSDAVQALVGIGPESLPVLIELFDKEGNGCRNRSTVAEGLGEMGPPARAAVPSLVKALKNEPGLLRASAALALWKIDKHSLALPTLIEVLKEKLEEVPHQGEFVGDPVRVAVRLDQDEVADLTLRALEEIGGQARAALPELNRALSHPSPALRERALSAIRKIDPEQGRKTRLDSEGKGMGVSGRLMSTTTDK